MWTFWKTFRLGKNFPGSNVTLLPRFFSLCPSAHEIICEQAPYSTITCNITWACFFLILLLDTVFLYGDDSPLLWDCLPPPQIGAQCILHLLCLGWIVARQSFRLKLCSVNCTVHCTALSKCLPAASDDRETVSSPLAKTYRRTCLLFAVEISCLIKPVFITLCGEGATIIFYLAPWSHM